MKEIDLEAILKAHMPTWYMTPTSTEMMVKAMREAVELALDMVQEKQDQFFSNKDWIENHSDGITDIIQEVKDSIKL